jgi:hypothetical protein
VSQFLTPVRPPVLPSFPASPSKGDTVVLSTDGHLYTFDGTGWVDNGAGGGGGTSTAYVRRMLYSLGV